jgi:hypothetical protein
MRTALSLSLIPPAQNRRSGADRTLAAGGRTIVKGDILSWGCRWRGSPVTMAYEFVDPAWPLPLRHDDGLAFGLQPAITPRTVRSEMFAFRAIVAADGQQPVPSWREHAPAGARRTRRSLPEVGEFARPRFITAMLIAVALPCGGSRACGRVSDFGSEMGAEGRWQARSITASVPAQEPLTCADVHNQAEHGAVCLADKEEVRGSSPRRPTTTQVRPLMPRPRAHS